MMSFAMSRKLFSSLLIIFIISVSLLCLYYGNSFTKFDHDDEGSLNDPFLISNNQNDPFVYTQFPKSFPVCDMRFSELIPCLDRNLIYQLKLKPNLALMEHYERHCPPRNRRYNCLIPPPLGYKIPIRWPASRDEVWKANIPHTHLADEKSDQRWMVVNGDKINFPGGGTHFHTGADKYIVALAQMLKFPNEKLNNGGNIRNVLDVGCGVASFGAYLLPLDIIAMSLAPNDVHENQIQFALERGIPATLGVLGTKRLPYPSRSFDLAHCSRCRIDWLQRDGILLMELDRVLRPGGFFVYSSPEAYAHDEANRRIWSAMSDLVQRMCWKIASKKNQTAIWAKPSSNGCYSRRDPGTRPPLCSSDDDPEAVWNVPMKACITPYTKKLLKKMISNNVSYWNLAATAAKTPHSLVLITGNSPSINLPAEQSPFSPVEFPNFAEVQTKARAPVEKTTMGHMGQPATTASLKEKSIMESKGQPAAIASLKEKSIIESRRQPAATATQKGKK